MTGSVRITSDFKASLNGQLTEKGFLQPFTVRQVHGF